MPDKFLPYGRQWIDDDDIASVVEVLKSDYLTTGPAVQQFEKSLCDFSGAKYASAVNSGTAALHAVYFAAGLQPGDEIITTPLTFAATANAALYLGGKVRFVDVEKDTGNIDAGLIEEAITERTKLIVPVDFTGHPADYDEIDAIAKRHGLSVIADAAHSLGATYRGRKVGTLADATETSFHPVKHITTGEGGAVLTDNAAIVRRVENFRSHGIERDPSCMTQCDGPWYYEQQDLGFNYRITDIGCGLGASQIRKLQGFVNRRREIAARYTSAFSDMPELMLPSVREYAEPAWHLYVVRVAGDAALRGKLFAKLRELGLGVQVHYIPVYYHSYYQSLGYEKGLCPNAEDFYSRCISLPMYPKMTDADVDSSIERVTQAVREIG